MEEKSQKITGETNSETYKRRGFLKKIIGILTAFGTLVLGIPFIGSIVTTGKERKNKKLIRIANLDQLPLNQPQKINFSDLVTDAFIEGFETRNVWVIKHSPSSVTVFSPICPHLGCSYDWQPQENSFVCPCHSSVFNLDGKVTEGPSPRSLDSLPQKIVDNILFIEWERFEVGATEKKAI